MIPVAASLLIQAFQSDSATCTEGGGGQLQLLNLIHSTKDNERIPTKATEFELDYLIVFDLDYYYDYLVLIHAWH